MSTPREFETLITEVTILPKGAAIYSEMATAVSLQDEAGGLFVKVSQSSGNDVEECIRIDHDEWSHIRTAIDQMILICETRKEKEEV